MFSLFVRSILHSMFCLNVLFNCTLNVLVYMFRSSVHSMLCLDVRSIVYSMFCLNVLFKCIFNVMFRSTVQWYTQCSVYRFVQFYTQCAVYWVRSTVQSIICIIYTEDLLFNIGLDDMYRRLFKYYVDIFILSYN